MKNSIRKIILLLALLLVVTPNDVWACATCYGASDSPLAQGMNMGIMFLLACIGVVILGICVFFAYIIRRAAVLERKAAGTNSTEVKHD
jgi:heme/copper-type cytochrome/quinol oxidase subunit 2